MDITIPLPASIALVLLGLFLIALTVPGFVKILRALTRRSRIPIVKDPVTRVFLIAVGLFCSGLGLYMLQKDLGPGEQSSACIYAEAAQTDSAAIPWLIRREAEAVVAQDVDTIQQIFASNGTIVRYENRQIVGTWRPLDYYEELLRNTTYSSAKNTEIRAVLVDGDTAYYTSGSEGTTITNGKADDYFNPGGANQWTLRKTGGCWQIIKFEINAYGVPFP